MKARYVIRHFIGTFVFFTLIFISASTINYWYGWIYVIIGLIMFTLNYTVFRIDPQLLNERSKPGTGTRQWDKLVLGFSFLATVAMYIIAGFDSGRFQWSPRFPVYLTIAGIALTSTGQLIFLIAQKQNKFFSSTVRIQSERNHTVCDKGLYSVVRHPGYLGSVIQALGFPLLFGSLWSIIPISVLIFLFLVRTKMEDDTLKDELNGYRAYSDKTPYRLIPLVW